jgi:molybdopterin/thiamine biosynthesis adenylyltransferase
MNPLAEHPFPDRDLRQRDLVPPERLAACQAVVIGVGAIGRQVALQLAAVGVARLGLFDHDTVADVNLASQGYRPDQLSLPKADATGQDCQRINPWIQIVPRAERFRRSTGRQIAASPIPLAVFACVDAITTRRLLWEALRHQAAFFVDGRMSAEVIRVVAVTTPATDDYYPSTLFEAGQAYAGSCTARSTIYTASIAAGLMVGQFTKWLRNLPVDADLTLNLLAAELTVAGDGATHPRR